MNAFKVFDSLRYKPSYPRGQVRHENVEQVKSFIFVFVRRKCDLLLSRTMTKRSAEEALSCSVDFQVKKWKNQHQKSLSTSSCSFCNS